MADDGVELVGPLPEVLQSYVTFTAAAAARGQRADAAKAFLEFLKTPRVRSVFERVGMELPR